MYNLFITWKLWYVRLYNRRGIPTFKTLSQNAKIDGTLGSYNRGIATFESLSQNGPR